MAMINVTNVSVLNNPSRFFSDFQARPRHHAARPLRVSRLTPLRERVHRSLR